MIVSLLLVLLLLPLPLAVSSDATTYYTEGDLTNIKASILSNSTRANYVNTMMKYHILSSTDNYRVARNLQNGSSILFFFDGCSDNMDSTTYSDYKNITFLHIAPWCRL